MSELENALLKNAKKGDMQAFEDLIIGYEKLIFNVAYRMLDNAEDAKDAAQEVLVKIYKNLHKISDIKGFNNWIYTVTNNTCIDHIRRRKGKLTLSIDAIIETDDGTMVHQIPSEEPTPEMVLDKKERARQIQIGINQLKANYRMLIILRDIKGLSYEEISATTGTAMGTVKSGLSRARLSLKNILNGMTEQNKL